MIVLTKEQIENHRKVLYGLVGPWAKFMSDEEINIWANNLQRKLDDIKYNWNIKVRGKHNSKLMWHEIENEPVNVLATINDVSNKCQELLNSYPSIQAIEISNINDSQMKYEFSKNF
jgi:hypothetical protein